MLPKSYSTLAWTIKHWSHTIKNPYLCVILQIALVQTVIALLNVKMKYQVKRYTSKYANMFIVTIVYQYYFYLGSFHPKGGTTN